MTETARQELHRKLDFILSCKRESYPAREVTDQIQVGYEWSRVYQVLGRNRRQLPSSGKFPFQNPGYCFRMSELLPILSGAHASSGIIQFRRNEKQLGYRFTGSDLFVRYADLEADRKPESFEQRIPLVLQGGSWRLLCEVPETPHAVTELYMEGTFMPAMCIKCNPSLMVGNNYPAAKAEERGRVLTFISNPKHSSRSQERQVSR